MFRLKETVGLAGMQPELMPAMIVAAEVHRELGFDCIITSVTDGHHTGASLHYAGFALDLRVKHIPVEQREAIRAEIASRLGPQFDVTLETDHQHLEFQPKSNL